MLSGRPSILTDPERLTGRNSAHPVAWQRGCSPRRHKISKHTCQGVRRRRLLRPRARDFGNARNAPSLIRHKRGRARHAGGRHPYKQEWHHHSPQNRTTEAFLHTPAPSPGQANRSMCRTPNRTCLEVHRHRLLHRQAQIIGNAPNARSLTRQETERARLAVENSLRELKWCHPGQHITRHPSRCIAQRNKLFISRQRPSSSTNKNNR